MEVTFKVGNTDGEMKTVTAGLVDVIAWEERFEKPSTELAGGEVFVRDYVWLAWHAEHRTGATTLDFMDWVAQVGDVEIAEEAAPLPPSENPPNIGSSPA